MAAPRCEYPQFIQRDRQTVVVPCGQCYTCRRGVVRRRQGQAAMEILHPQFRSHVLPEMQHFFTLTYADPAPQTKPVPHELGTVVDESGQVRPYRGPFPKGTGRIRWEDDVPIWDETGRRVSKRMLADLHADYLEDRLNWSPDQVREWVDGTYAPLDTLVVRHRQNFMKRLRERVARAGLPDPIRFLISGEYGGVTDRPHWHLFLWGLPPEMTDVVHDAWSGYQTKDFVPGHVEPSRWECRVHRASVARGKAADYQSKDLVKGRGQLAVSPSMLARTRPHVQGSLKPPIGAAGYPWWFEHRIMSTVRLAQEEPLPEWFHSYDESVRREAYVCWRVRQAYTMLAVSLHGSLEKRYPTTTTWRRRVRADLGWGVDGIQSLESVPWDIATAYDLHLRAGDARFYEGEGRELFDEHVGALRERAEVAQERERRRKEQKRARLVAAGKLRP